MDEDRNYKKPLATHEIKRSSILTSLLVVAIALFIPILLAPEKESEEFYEPEEIVQQLPPEEPPMELEAFGNYQKPEEYPLLTAFKDFVMNYTVIGMIYGNVDKEKVKDSFGNLQEGAQEITTRSRENQRRTDNQ